MEHGDTLQYAYRRSCQKSEQGINAAGGKAIIFGTITVRMVSRWVRQDAILTVSREVIADSIEQVAGAEGFDGVVAMEGATRTCLLALIALHD